MSDSGQFSKDFRRKMGRALHELDNVQVQHDERIADQNKRLEAVEELVLPLRKMLWAALMAGASGVGLWVFTKLSGG